MKRLFVLSLFLFSVSVFGQVTIDFDTTGQSYAWTVFANGTGDPSDFGVIPNPNPSGINTSANVVKFKVNADAAVFAGAFTDNVSFTVNADNSNPSIMFHKEVISDCAFKFEGPGLNREVKVPNTVINQWEKLTFDFSAEIGKTVTRIVVFPDFPAARTAISMNYFDNIEFIAVIPVELTSFSATVVGNNVQLHWATATETNNQGFEIQRSVDNRNFEKIAFVNGKGTTTEKQNYSYVDNTELSGSVYYRLKQTDFNGKYDYSKVVEVTKVVISYALAQNYPNPFNPTTAITYSIPENSFVTLKVYNVLGSEVADLVNGVVEAGVHSLNFNAIGLNSGVYFYTIKAGNFSETKKLMLMK